MLSNIVARITEAWKTIVTAAGVVLLIWNQLAPGLSDVMPPSWQHWISAVVGVVTIIANYGVPNVTKFAHRAVGRSVRIKGQKPERLPKAA